MVPWARVRQWRDMQLQQATFQHSYMILPNYVKAYAWEATGRNRMRITDLKDLS